LLARGIASEQPEKLDLADAPAVQDLVALLDALVSPHHHLSLARALKSPLFGWSDDVFLRLTEGSPIRRIGHERWLRNIALAMGNALRSSLVSPADQAGLRASLQGRADHSSEVVREQVAWALGQ
jgi:epoxyqueuosine reductase QueG